MVRPEHIPQALIERHQWLLWRLENRGGKKPTKTPHSVHGGMGKSNDPSTWASFGDALGACEQRGFDGIGFVMAEGDGLVAVDLDGCYDPETMTPTPAAQEITERFRHCGYLELSPSGRGFRIFTYGKARRCGKGNGDDKWIEVYDHTSPRYVTVTGNSYGQPRPILDGQAALDWLHEKYFRKEDRKPIHRPAPSAPVTLSDQELFERIERSKQGPDFRRLYNGHAGDDHSSADMELCNILAFWCGRDPYMMDRIFRGSGLMRPKWDRNAGNGMTYGQRTIDKAIEGCRDVYDPERYKKRANLPGSGGRLATPPGEPPSSSADSSEIDPFILMKGGATDEGNANAVYQLFGADFVWCSAYGWLHWCGSHWQRANAEQHLDRAIVEALVLRRQAASKLNNEHVIKHAKPDSSKVKSCKHLFQSKVFVSVDLFDSDPDLLNCENGTIHLPTGELRPHKREDWLTYAIKIGLKMDADSSHWEEFLRGVVAGDGDVIEEMITYLQTCVGYSLTGHTSEEVLWYIHGPPRSGKGTFTETLSSILGSPLSTEVDFGTFTAERNNDANNFDLAPLKPARIVFASESERHKRINGAKVKAMTGGNNVRCCFKHKDFFDYKPMYKIWLSSNYPPNGDVDDDALWGRLRVLVFPHSHLGKENKGLKQLMRDRRNLEGVLAWAVQGAQRWYGSRNTGLQTPNHVDEETRRVRDELDTVAHWIEEEVEVDVESDVFVANADLYNSYANWCEQNGVTPKKKKSLTQALNSKGIEGPTVKKINMKTNRVWLGVRLI